VHGNFCEIKVSVLRTSRSVATAPGLDTLGLIGRLRDGHEELPACAWLISPWTDLTMSGSTLASKAAVDPLIHKEYLNELADAYLPAGMA
jgi:hypothetical protein